MFQSADSVKSGLSVAVAVLFDIEKVQVSILILLGYRIYPKRYEQILKDHCVA